MGEDFYYIRVGRLYRTHMSKARARTLHWHLPQLSWRRRDIIFVLGMELKNACGTNNIRSAQLLATVNSSNYTFNDMIGNGKSSYNFDEASGHNLKSSKT